MLGAAAWPVRTDRMVRVVSRVDIVAACRPRSQRSSAFQYPQSLGVHDDYASAQKAVDYLSDEDFPVQNVLIVGIILQAGRAGHRPPDVGPRADRRAPGRARGWAC